MKLSFLWKYSKTEDEMATTKSIALLDLNEHCLRHIGHFLPAKDAYSFGHTCTELFQIASKLQLRITIRSSKDLRYLHYFQAEIKDLIVDTSGKFTENDRMNLLSIMGNCTKLTSLDLSWLDSRILSSKCFHNLAHKLVHLKMSLMERSKIRWPKFIASMRKCENLRSLHIEYDEKDLIQSSDELTELFSIEFPKLKVFHFYTEEDYPDAYMRLDTFFRHNNQLEIVEINGPIFGAYLEALRLCLPLKKITLHLDWREVEALDTKVLALNKLPVLEATSLHCHASHMLSSMLQRMPSLKELTVKCTLSENFIKDIFGLPQIATLKVIVWGTYHTPSFTQYLVNIFRSTHGFPETVKRLLYHAPNLTKLTELDLSHIDPYFRISSDDITKFTEFIMKCPKLEFIKFPYLFPIDCLYKELLKHKENFGRRAREKTLRLEIESAVLWVPRYSYGRQTHNIVIQDDKGNESSTSISSIIRYGDMKGFHQITNLGLLCFVLSTHYLFNKFNRLFSTYLLCNK